VRESVGAPEEIPVFFPARRETLFGMLTPPEGKARGIAVIVLQGAGYPTTATRSSLRFCRRLSANGYHAFRFDYHGVGESSGAVDEFRLSDPFAEDLAGATEWLRSQGVSGFLLWGGCFGALTALAAAKRIPELRGMVLASTPVRAFDWRQASSLATEGSGWHLVRRAVRPRTLKHLLQGPERSLLTQVVRAKLETSTARLRRRPSARRPDNLTWVSSRFLTQLRDAVERGIPVLFVFGPDDQYSEDFQLARSGRLGRLIDWAGPKIEVKMIPQLFHGFTRASVQEELFELSLGWLAEIGTDPAGITR
jgi:pimeloyl-ACP methyl ester carboxylesterase